LEIVREAGGGEADRFNLLTFEQLVLQASALLTFDLELPRRFRKPLLEDRRRRAARIQRPRARSPSGIPAPRTRTVLGQKLWTVQAASKARVRSNSSIALSMSARCRCRWAIWPSMRLTERLSSAVASFAGGDSMS
jgi:hypothetical protein